MPSPFPGMDPYLENPARWRAVHNRFISAIDEALSESLPSNFITTIKERVYLVQPEKYLYPDVLIVSGGEREKTARSAGTAAILMADPPFTVTLPDDEMYEAFIEVRMVGAKERVVKVSLM